MAKVIETNIESLVPDNKNFNKGTQFGDHLMDESLRRFGLGRSILIDKSNRIIAGNKTAEKAADIGFTDVVVVEVDGNQLVAVKRKDIDLDSAKGRELALADNATGKANLAWDEELIADLSAQFNFEPGDWGVDVENVNPDDYGTDFALNSGDKKPIQQMAFTLSDGQAEMIKNCIQRILAVYGDECVEVDGNKNKNGNALAKIVSLWAEQGKLK